MKQNPYKLILISALRTAPWNYKQTEGEKVDRAKQKLRAAIKKRGQIVNLIVRPLPPEEVGQELYEVVNGNHRLEVFQEEGAQDAICCDVGEITQQEADMIALETNELNIDADPIKLGRMLADIIKVHPIDSSVATLPYTVEEVTNYVKAVDFSWNQFLPKPPDDSAGVSGGNNVKLELNISKELASEFKDAIKAFPRHEDAIRSCIGHLKALNAV